MPRPRRNARPRVFAAAVQTLLALCLLPAGHLAHTRRPAPLRKGALVLPLKTEGEPDGRDARVARAAQNILENLLSLHDGLEEGLLARHDRDFTPYEISSALRNGSDLDPTALARVDLRYFVSGRLGARGGGFEAALEIEDRESGRKVLRTLPLDAPALERFREGFITMLEEAGLPVTPGQRAKMLWQEELPVATLEALGHGLSSPFDPSFLSKAFGREVEPSPRLDDAGWLSKTLGDASRSYVLLDNLGWALASLGWAESADIVFEKALALNPAGYDAARGELLVAGRARDPLRAAVFRALAAEARDPNVTPAHLSELLASYGRLKGDMRRRGSRYERGDVGGNGSGRGGARGVVGAKGMASSHAGISAAKGSIESGEPLGISGGTFSNWGGFASEVTDFEDAARFYERVLKDVDGGGRGTKEELAAVLNKLGIALTSLGRQREALERFDRALEMANALGDRGNYGLTLNNRGLAYASFGRYSDAVASFNTALRVAEGEGDDAGRAVILCNLGLVSGALAEYDKATNFYTQALNIQRGPGGSREDAGVTLNNLGVAYAAMGRAEDSIKQYEAALTLARDAGDAGGEALALNNIANALRELGQYERAAAKYEEALVIARGKNRIAVEGIAVNGLGVVRYQQGRYAEAAGLFAEALPLRRAISNRLGEGITLHNLMLTWKARGNVPAAIFFGKQAVNVYQDLRADIERLGKAPHESFLQSKVETYRQLADLLLSLDRLPEAELVLGMLKEEELSEFTRGDDDTPTTLRAKLTEDPRLEAEYARMADQIAALGRRRAQLIAQKEAAVADGRPPAEFDRQLAGITAQRDIAVDHFNAYLDQIQKEPGARGNVEAVRDAGAMRATLRELGEGTVLLYTLVGEDAYRVMLITPDSEQAYESRIGKPALRGKVEDFRAALRNRRVDPAPLARDLYKILVGPDLERDLKAAGAKTLMWSLDSVLRYVPVAALQDGAGKYLVEQYRNVIYTPASRDRLKDPVAPHWKGLGAGRSKGLPGVPLELRSIFREGESAGGEGVLEGKVLLDENFRKDKLLAALSTPPQLVHIASHFTFQPGGTRDDSFLLLGAGDGAEGRLTLKEVTRLDFQGVNLLTLSACDTAIGDLRASGVEVESFGVLAQRQGAEAVLATLWRVADGPTPMLMHEFYRAREAGAGMTKAEALQKAQLALLNGDVNAPVPAQENNPDTGPAAGAAPAPSGGSALRPFSPDAARPFSHPYYWAPFILIGNWK